MSNNTWSRPVRLLQPQQYTLVPVAAPSRPASGVERFRRTLGSSQRAEVAASPAPLAQPQGHSTAPTGATGTRPRWSDDEREPAPPPARVRNAEPADAPAPPPRMAQFTRPPPFVAAQAFGAGESTGDTADAWPHAMANFIEALCARADAAFRSWSATIALDAQALPGTELHLNLSPHWLRLRFSTQSAPSAALISRHRARLISLLEEAPSLPQGIDVDIA